MSSFEPCPQLFRSAKWRSLNTTVNLAVKIPQWIAPAVEVLLGIYSVEGLAQSDPRVREHNTVDYQLVAVVLVTKVKYKVIWLFWYYLVH